jgi:hypothetical protein
LVDFGRVFTTIVELFTNIHTAHTSFFRLRWYKRFHLDMINIRAFLESMLAGDAPEVVHDDVIWNATTEMMDRVDKYVTLVRGGGDMATNNNSQVPNYDDNDIQKTIHTLQHLRLVCQEVAIQLERNKRNPKTKKNNKFLEKANDGEAHYWPRMVQDVDNTIHDFTHRHEKDPPKFKIRRLVVRANGDDDDSSSSSDDDDDNDNSVPKERKLQKTDTAKKKKNTKQRQDKVVITSDLGRLKTSFQELPQLQPFQEDLVIADSCSVKVEDKILVRLANNHQAEGSILTISEQIRSFYVHYEDLPTYFDEYQPVDCTTQNMDIPGPCEPSSSSHDVTDESGDGSSRTVQTVYCRLGGEGEVSITLSSQLNIPCNVAAERNSQQCFRTLFL